MIQTRFAITFGLMLLLTFQAPCSDDKGKEEEFHGMTPVPNPLKDDLTQRHAKAVDIIKKNPFTKDKDIFAYIDTLNKAVRLDEEARDQVRLHFKENTYSALCLDQSHKTALQVYYGLDGLDGVHPIIFHHIQHEQDPRTIKLDLANVMTIDDNRQLREVESVVRWARIPESLKKWAKKWPSISTGEYVSIVHKLLEKDNLVLYPPEYYDLATWPKPEGDRLNQFYEYRCQWTEKSNYIYMNRGGECFMTRIAAVCFQPLNQPDLSELDSYITNPLSTYFGATVPITRNGDFFYFKKLEITELLRNFATTEIVKHPVPGKKNKFKESRTLVLKPYSIENKGHQLIPQGELEQGFYTFLEEIVPAPERGVRQIWLREPASSKGRLEIQLDGVKVNGLWKAPLSKAAPAVFPCRDDDGKWVLDLSTTVCSMVPADYQELRVYLRSAYLMGLDSAILRHLPNKMPLVDKGFFMEDATQWGIAEEVEVQPHHINSMVRYWKSLLELMDSLKDLSWLKFDFAAGLLFREDQGAESLTETQRSQLVSKLVEIKQIHMPKVKLTTKIYAPFFQTMRNNSHTLTHLDFTGAIGLKEIEIEFVWGVEKLPQLKFLSVIQSDFGKKNSRAARWLTNELKDQANLKELKISVPYSTWASTPKTLMYPVELLNEAWFGKDKSLTRLCVICFPMTIYCAAISSVCGLKQDISSCLFDQPAFSDQFGEEFAQVYQNLIRVPNVERLTLDIGGYQQNLYNMISGQFISDHNKLHKEAPPVQIEFMN